MLVHQFNINKLIPIFFLSLTIRPALIAIFTPIVLAIPIRYLFHPYLSFEANSDNVGIDTNVSAVITIFYFKSQSYFLFAQINSPSKSLLLIRTCIYSPKTRLLFHALR